MVPIPVSHVVSLFNLRGPVEISDFRSRGNINQQTYLIVAAAPADPREYILQLLNSDVFAEPRRVMEAMVSCIEAQKSALSKGVLGKDPEWETIRLVPTREGNSFLELRDEGIPKCWRMMVRIPEVRSYKSLGEIPDLKVRLKVAEEAGKGLALFGILTAAMDLSGAADPLPGYRNTGLYYNQLLSVLAGSRTSREASDYLPADPVIRRSTEKHFLIHIDPEEYRRRISDPELAPFLSLALQERSFALTLAGKLAAGELEKAIIHGDTKLENFLFSSRTGRVNALIDLDTVMPHTWLTDWGDLVRSLANVTGERETELNKIKVDSGILDAAARGFINAGGRIAPQEAELMADAPAIMALELGVRFLADYLRGDNYFSLKPEDPRDLNKIRAMAQFQLFKRLRECSRSAKASMDRLIRASSGGR